MPSARSCKASNLLLITNDNGACTGTLESMLVSCSPSVLQGSGSRSTAGLEDMVMANTHTKRPYYAPGEPSEETGDDDIIDDSCVHQPEKKRRLTLQQVKFLEKSFELENKLEPDRKVQLAKDLNLQPRQVAVWFQNRRARWKTKQLEKDYAALKLNYDSLKAEFDSLMREKEQLQEEVRLLTTKLEETPTTKDNNSECAAKSSQDEKEEAKDETELPAIATDIHNIKKEQGMEEKREASASSGSEESAVCDATSPHPIDSALSQEEDLLISKIPIISIHEAPNDLSVSAVEGCTVSSKFFAGQECPHMLKTEEAEEDETYSFCNFSLDDQGPFPWWSVSWP